MMNGGEAANRRYGAKGASQTGRYIVMTLQFGNKLHSANLSQLNSGTSSQHLKLQGKIWAGLRGGVGQRT